jgi:hypothetical protein
LASDIGPIVRRYGGFIDNFVGDALLCIFPHDATGAVLAAIGIQNAVAAFNVVHLPARHRDRDQTAWTQTSGAGDDVSTDGEYDVTDDGSSDYDGDDSDESGSATPAHRIGASSANAQHTHTTHSMHAHSLHRASTPSSAATRVAAAIVAASVAAAAATAPLQPPPDMRTASTGAHDGYGEQPVAPLARRSVSFSEPVAHLATPPRSGASTGRGRRASAVLSTVCVTCACDIVLTVSHGTRRSSSQETMAPSTADTSTHTHASRGGSVVVAQQRRRASVPLSIVPHVSSNRSEPAPHSPDTQGWPRKQSVTARGVSADAVVPPRITRTSCVCTGGVWV